MKEQLRWWLASVAVATALGSIGSALANVPSRPFPSVPSRAATPVSVVHRPATPPCPPGTVYDPRIGRCVVSRVPGPPGGLPPGHSSGPMRPGNARSNDPDEVSATNLVNSAMRGLSCGQAGDSLRRLSNQILKLAASASSSTSTDPRDFKEQWRRHIRSPQFWSKVWNKMADAYRSCNRTCFDDGVAVGEISATAYCSASIAVQGLPGIGVLEQPPLPVCETAIHVGCIQSYQRTAGAYAGCGPYTYDTYSGIFAEYQSQDCHL